MNRRTYGVLAGFIAAGVSMWWWRSRAGRMMSDTSDNGRLIYDNTPRASTPDGNL